jgi:hypothetical protein
MLAAVLNDEGFTTADGLKREIKNSGSGMLQKRKIPELVKQSLHQLRGILNTLVAIWRIAHAHVKTVKGVVDAAKEARARRREKAAAAALLRYKTEVLAEEDARSLSQLEAEFEVSDDDEDSDDDDEEIGVTFEKTGLKDLDALFEDISQPLALVGAINAQMHAAFTQFKIAVPERFLRHADINVGDTGATSDVALASGVVGGSDGKKREPKSAAAKKNAARKEQRALEQAATAMAANAKGSGMSAAVSMTDCDVQNVVFKLRNKIALLYGRLCFNKSMLDVQADLKARIFANRRTDRKRGGGGGNDDVAVTVTTATGEPVGGGGDGGGDCPLPSQTSVRAALSSPFDVRLDIEWDPVKVKVADAGERDDGMGHEYSYGLGGDVVLAPMLTQVIQGINNLLSTVAHLVVIVPPITGVVWTKLHRVMIQFTDLSAIMKRAVAQLGKKEGPRAVMAAERNYSRAKLMFQKIKNTRGNALFMLRSLARGLNGPSVMLSSLSQVSTEIKDSGILVFDHTFSMSRPELMMANKMYNDVVVHSKAFLSLLGKTLLQDAVYEFQQTLRTYGLHAVAHLESVVIGGVDGGGGDDAFDALDVTYDPLVDESGNVVGSGRANSKTHRVSEAVGGRGSVARELATGRQNAKAAVATSAAAKAAAAKNQKFIESLPPFVRPMCQALDRLVLAFNNARKENLQVRHSLKRSAGQFGGVAEDNIRKETFIAGMSALDTRKAVRRVLRNVEKLDDSVRRMFTLDCCVDGEIGR